MGRGQLLFKGDKAKKKKKKPKHNSKKEEERSSADADPAAAASAPESSSLPPSSTTAAAAAKPKASSSSVATGIPTVRKGTGKITTSGTVVTGYDTIFEKEVATGDALMCVLGNGQDELRVITMRLSNQSLNLSSAFSISLKTPTSFQYIRKPRDMAKERRDAQNKQNETREQQEMHSFDLYSSEKMVYREKTETGSYRIKNELVQDGKSRGDLLYMRAKKTSDKYC
jgi:hypothetical protein